MIMKFTTPDHFVIFVHLVHTKKLSEVEFGGGDAYFQTVREIS